MKIKNQLFLIILLITIPSVLIPSIMIFQSHASELESKIIQEMSVDSIHVMDKISRMIYERNADISTFALNAGIIIDSKTNQINAQELKIFENTLREYERISKAYSSISIYDLSGIKISDTRNFESITDDYSEEEFFKNALNSNYFDKYPTFSNELKKEVIHFSAPIKNKDGETSAIIVTKMPTTRLYDIISTSNENREGYETHLLSHDGNVIFSTSRDKAFDKEFFNELTNEKMKILKKDDKNQVSNIFLITEDKGFLDQKSLEWYIVTQATEDKIYQSLIELQRNTAIVVGVILIISIIVTRLFMNSFSKPVLKLAKISQKVSSGSKKIEFPVIESNDEFNILSKSIKKMYSYQENISEQLENKLIELKKSGKEKDEFMAMLSHEMKTPLMPILGYSEMLLMPELIGKLNEQQTDAVKNIEKNGKHLQKMILELLQLQRMEVLTGSVSISEIKLKKFYDELLDDIKSKINEKNIKVIIEESKIDTIFSDEIKLKQVFTNIILNAIDFIPKNTGEIKIRSEIDIKDFVKFSIKDNGRGIPTEDLLKIFTKFYQVDTGIAREHDGSGLGLSICKEIVEIMKGEIWAESKKGKGSKFIFSIPGPYSEIREKRII